MISASLSRSHWTEVNRLLGTSSTEQENGADCKGNNGDDRLRNKNERAMLDLKFHR